MAEVETFIELWSRTVKTHGERELKGDIDKYKTLRDNAVKFRAVVHNHVDGKEGEVPSTVFHVVAEESFIQDMIDDDHSHTDWGLEDGAYRGLKLNPGTPVDTEADDLRSRIQNDIGTDISTVNDVPEDMADHPNSSANYGQDTLSFLKNDNPSIGQGNWMCEHPDHSSPEVNSIDNDCSLGHTSNRTENEYAVHHTNPFDPTGWIQ